MTKTWKKRVRQVYDSLEDLQAWDEVYNVVKRCGYSSAKKLWEANPIIGGSTNPKDFGLA